MKHLVRIGKLLLFMLLLAGIAGFSVLLIYARDLPRPGRIGEIAFAKPTKIYDASGDVLLYELYGERKREFVPLEDIPLHLQRGVIAIEDRRFYGHWGIDPIGIARAVLSNIRAGGIDQGASTITQQLARTAFLTTERVLPRKIREILLTLDIERRYTKDEILEFYLNQVPLGSNAYGVGAASFLYFGKPVQELSLAESSVLAAMIKAPTYYSPFGDNREALLARRGHVLRAMAEEGHIAQEEAGRAAEELPLFASPGFSMRAPHAVLEVVDQLVETYGETFLREHGLRVITTIDWNMQKAAEDSIDAFEKRNEAFGAYNEALVAIDPRTGAVRAMVGSKDWYGDPYPEGCTPGKDCLFDPKLNAATHIPGRQPGSAFKPFVYATAFLKGYDDNTTVIDEETTFGIWGGEEYVPQNYDEKFRGEVTLREALAQSLNIPAVKVILEMAGIEDSIATARAMGITTLNKPASSYGPSIVLGSGEVRLLDMVSSYGVFANQGKRATPFFIKRVEDERGRVLEEHTPAPVPVLPASVSGLVADILADNEARTPVFGPFSSLHIPGTRASAKTGTTNDYRDAWTIGFTDSIAAGVWTGNNNNDPMEKAPGAAVSAPIWRAFMDRVLD